MEGPGRDASTVLSDGRSLDYWEGGDPHGRGVIYHGGTPTTRVFGRLGHETAREQGVRLVSISRPGYEGSGRPPGAPSLLTTGRDTAELAQQLGLSGYAVLGVSGGGPFAVATAVADPASVRAVGVVAGIGPWRQLKDPSDDDSDQETEDRALLALLDAGDLDAAWTGSMDSARRELSGLVGLDDEARVDAFFASMPTPMTDPYHRSLWAASLADVVERPDGYVFDNLAWGAVWDVDLKEVVAPTALWYGDADVICAPSIGEWYADQIAGAELVVLPGEGHLEVCSNHWAEQLSGLLERWRG
jgi:pimeloyl-ACP methyl ester carboxylesterase